MENKEKTIYDLKLHETLWNDEIGATVIRVPEGWLYRYKRDIYMDGYYRKEASSTVFVPYNNEFSI